VDYAWSDVGSWDAVHGLLVADEANNVIEGRAIIFDGKNNFVHSTQHFTALYGVDDLVCIVTSDAVLLTKRGKTENIKDIVAALKSKRLDEAE
jgi:mannose-1-phosphate guanylyltransferase / mannose-6-phosphate isomerase